MNSIENTDLSGKIVYLEQIFKIAQDRRYSTAIDVWAIVLDAEFSNRKYHSLDDREILGITASDIATSLNMHLSSVYHNLKILQSDDLELLNTEDLIIYNEKGRRVKQKVYQIPRIYYDEFQLVLRELQDEGFQYPHRLFTFFNILKIRGILSHYAALLHKDRVLTRNDFEEVDDWYHKWLEPINIRASVVAPGVIYKFAADDMRKILPQIIELLNKHVDSYTDEHEAKGIMPVSFSYLLFVPYNEIMRQGEWLNRDEFDERVTENMVRLSKDDMKECEADHDTFFKYGLACPVCKEKP
ncbi:MAG: hypothetical protein GOP50_01185 [Candidatus Heimdallarchaeota archaeon]|nr:hypothetical protein [Candidatus Heimdallarchaeota archaeon]